MLGRAVCALPAHAARCGALEKLLAAQRREWIVRIVGVYLWVPTHAEARIDGRGEVSLVGESVGGRDFLSWVTKRFGATTVTDTYGEFWLLGWSGTAGRGCPAHFLLKTTHCHSQL